MNANQLSSACHANQKSPSSPLFGRRVSYHDDDLDDLTFRPASKNVTFNEAVTVQPIPEVASEMLPSERCKLYYSVAETVMFRTEAKQICIRVIRRARSDATIKDPGMTSEEHISAILKADSSLRGLEKYTCPQRVRNKTTVMSTILPYHRHLKQSILPKRKQEECLSSAYARLSHWSLLNALEDARVDCLQAYGEEDGSSQESGAVGDLQGYNQEFVKAKCLAESKKPIAIEPFPKLTKKRKR